MCGLVEPLSQYRFHRSDSDKGATRLPQISVKFNSDSIRTVQTRFRLSFIALTRPRPWSS